jgi:hypothetical protein
VTTRPDDGLAERLVLWMADNRPRLDELMAEERSRALHEEFILAEGGTLPDRATRVGRAREASVRAWTRHLVRALAREWAGGEPGLPPALDRWMAGAAERREALVLEERAVLERRGASGDPAADERDAELTAACRLLAEGLAATAAPLVAAEEAPAFFGRRVAERMRETGRERREVERRAREAWSTAGEAGAVPPMTAAADTAPEPDATRIEEAAAVWAHVRSLADALEHALRARPPTAG